MATERKGSATSPNAKPGMRARISYNGVNYERSVRTKEQLKKWRAQMLVDLERCPVEISLIRNQWVVTLDTPMGDVVKKFPTLDPAIQWLNRAKSDISHGVYLTDGDANKTLADFVSTWKSSKHRAKGRTMQRYNTLLANQILPHLGNQKLRAISPARVRSWISELVSEGTGAPTIKKAHALLRQIMKTAFEDELIRRNPVVAMELPTVVPKEQRALTIQELLRLSEMRPDYKALILVMGIMGLRIGEACALQVQDVNLFKGELTVRRGMTHGENYKRFTDTTKTKQVRTIPIPAPLGALLAPLVDGQKPSSPVFRGARGGAINDGWFRRAVMGPAVSSLGWDDVSLHNLRHTCASLLISSGTPITAVSKILGHSTVVQTLNTYGHYYSDDIKASMENMGAIFVSARGLDGDSQKQLMA
jgi:integrase